MGTNATLRRLLTIAYLHRMCFRKRLIGEHLYLHEKWEREHTDYRPFTEKKQEQSPNNDKKKSSGGDK